MLYMYIVYITNPLVIEIKNILNTITSVVYITILETIVFVNNSLRQTSQWIIMEENVMEIYFTANSFHAIFSLVHTNSF